MTAFVTRPPQFSGVPLGAIGAGSIELRPDGEFHAWQIANPERFRQDCRKRPNADDGERLTGSLSFALRTEDADGVLLRRLGFGTGDSNCRMYSFVKPVSAIEYRGTFPIAALTYRDDALPVEASLEAASPFVPHDEDTAGTPGIILTFSICNRSAKPVTVSLAGKLKSIVSSGADGYGRRCRVIRSDAFTGILSESAPSVPDAPDRGSVLLSAAGADCSVLSGEYRRYMDEFVAHGSLGVSEESYLFAFYRSGRLPDTAFDARLDPALLAADPDALPDADVQWLFAALTARPCAAGIAERLQTGAEKQLCDPAFLREAVRYLQKNLRELDADEWGDGALCVRKTLAPRETARIPFVLSWYFPTLCSATGTFVGHRYAARFSNAAEAAASLWASRPAILRQVRAFCETLYTGSYPEYFSDAVSIHLSTLVKSSWWAADGDFGIWEGLGSCGLHTTDISYHGTFGLCALFPRLQHRQMRQTAAKMRFDGAVPHFFSPDFSAVDDGFDRVDLNPQFVLLVCRDWIATGDRTQAEALFPAVCADMDRTQSLDRNGDGLPDTETQRNTYDAWRFSGTPIYVATLWLAALKAAARLADDLGCAQRADAWRALLRKGTESAVRLLWNGEYFDLWHDGAQRDECCMTDQLDGDCFCRMIGLGGIFDDARVCKTLDTVWRTNFSSERGLINAGCPAGKHATLYTIRNCQGEANWSGIEYWFAAYLLRMGSYERAKTLVQTVQERYVRLGQVWNHAECGDYYYRPLSGFALPGALSGFVADAAAQTLRFAPALPTVCAPWFTPSGYGTISESPASLELTVRSGSLAARRMLLPGGAVVRLLAVDGVELPFAVSDTTEGLAVTFAPICVTEGQVLTVSGNLY